MAELSGQRLVAAAGEYRAAGTPHACRRQRVRQTAWPSDIELSANLVAAAWQLAAISPLNALDQLALLARHRSSCLLASRH